MRKTALAAVAVGLCALPLQAQEAKHYTQEATLAAKVGIANYEVVKTELKGRAEYEVTLLGPANELKGSAVVKELPNGVESVTITEPDKPTLTVIFDKKKGTLTIIEGKRRGKATVIEGKWVDDATMKHFKATRSPTVELAGAILTDVVTTPRMKERKPISESGVCDPGAEVVVQAAASLGGIDTAPPGTSGHNARCGGWTCRGSSIGGYKSYCCSQAIQDAHLCCWDMYCAGCPCLGECDTICWVQMYFCACGVTGIACGPPPPSPYPTPPPS